MRFGLTTAPNIKITFNWAATWCNFIDMCHQLGVTWCLYLQERFIHNVVAYQTTRHHIPEAILNLDFASKLYMPCNYAYFMSLDQYRSLQFQFYIYLVIETAISSQSICISSPRDE